MPFSRIKSSAAWEFSLSFSLSSENSGSHLTRFILLTKGVGPGLIVSGDYCLLLSPCVPALLLVTGASAFPLFWLYALTFSFKLITNGLKKEKTQLKGCLSHAHRHIFQCVCTHVHKPYHTHMDTIYTHPIHLTVYKHTCIPHYMHAAHIQAQYPQNTLHAIHMYTFMYTKHTTYMYK